MPETEETSKLAHLQHLLRTLSPDQQRRALDNIRAELEARHGKKQAARN